MKQKLARVLSLILALCLMLPGVALATDYQVTVTVSGGGETIVWTDFSGKTENSTFFALVMSIIGDDAKKAELKDAFPGFSVGSIRSEGMDAYGEYLDGNRTPWIEFVNTYFDGNALLMDPTLTFGEAGGNGTYSITYSGITFSVTLDDGTGADPTPTDPVDEPSPSTPTTPTTPTTPSDPFTPVTPVNPDEPTPGTPDQPGTDVDPDGPQPGPTPALQFADPSVSGVSSYLNTEDGFAYMIGDENGNFNPEMTMTRAQMSQIFYNLLLNKTVTGGILKFRDVAEDAWYATAVNTLAALGIVKGIGNQTFEPDREITRAEFVAMCARFARISYYEVKFNDVPETHWGAKEIAAAASYGWIEADEDGNFGPAEIITRAEACVIMNRVLGRDASENMPTSFPDLVKFINSWI